MASKLGSGVLTVMAESRSAHPAAVTSSAARARATSAYSAAACLAAASVAAAPSRMAISLVSPAASSSEHWSAAQGSIPAPVTPSSAAPDCSARGDSALPFRPRKSRRLPV